MVSRSVSRCAAFHTLKYVHSTDCSVDSLVIGK